MGKILPKKKGEKYHSVVIPDLGIYTQGKDYADCLRKARSALEDLLETEIVVQADGRSTFTVTSSELKPLTGRFLETLREDHGLTIREVALRLGKSSPNYYAQYEQGKSLPSMETISEFVKAMAPGMDILLSLKKIG